MNTSDTHAGHVGKSCRSDVCWMEGQVKRVAARLREKNGPATNKVQHPPPNRVLLESLSRCAPSHHRQLRRVTLGAAAVRKSNTGESHTGESNCSRTKGNSLLRLPIGKICPSG